MLQPALFSAQDRREVEKIALASFRTLPLKFAEKSQGGWGQKWDPAESMGEKWGRGPGNSIPGLGGNSRRKNLSL